MPHRDKDCDKCGVTGIFIKGDFRHRRYVLLCPSCGNQWIIEREDENDD